MIALLVALGCTNRPPVLLAINDRSYSYDLFGDGMGGPTFDLVGGETLELSLDVRDPDGDAVEIRFSDMPGILTFDPFGTEGTLEVFEQALDTGRHSEIRALIVLLDDHDPPAWSETEVYFYYPREEDSGR